MMECWIRVPCLRSLPSLRCVEQARPCGDGGSNLIVPDHSDTPAFCLVTRIRIPLAMTRYSYLIPTNSFRIYHTHRPPAVK